MAGRATFGAEDSRVGPLVGHATSAVGQIGQANPAGRRRRPGRQVARRPQALVRTEEFARRQGRKISQWLGKRRGLSDALDPRPEADSADEISDADDDTDEEVDTDDDTTPKDD